MKNNKKTITIVCIIIQLLIVGCKYQDSSNISSQSLKKSPISDSQSTDSQKNSVIKSSSNDSQKIKDIANKFTVKIMMKVGNAEVNGNGIIFDVQGSNYYVLTTNHIFSSRTSKMKIEDATEDDLKNITSNEKLEITTPDGKSHTVDTKTITPLPNNLDLAYFQFKSTPNSYEKALLTNENALEEIIYIYGYKKCDYLKANSLEFNPGNIKKLPKVAKAIDGGYSLYYTNRAIETMSGSPIMNMKGEVVAIHGRSRGDKAKISKHFLKTCEDLTPYFGENYGIPVGEFIDAFRTPKNRP